MEDGPDGPSKGSQYTYLLSWEDAARFERCLAAGQPAFI